MASQLTLAEREVVSQMVYAGESNVEISRATGRHRTTVWRERKRNGDGEDYSAAAAQRRAERRRSERPLARKMERRQILAYVTDKLNARWSPDQISNRLRHELPDEVQRHVSHQTIYAWIRSRPAKERSHWRERLRRGGSQRPPNDRRGRLRHAPSIAGRPNVVNERQRFGDWEVDTVIGAQHSGAFVTLVERKSRYLLALKSCDRQAWRICDKLIIMLAVLPRLLRRTVTFDNGKEFADHERLKRRTNITAYFADPYCSWQRGTSENTNGLLRQYFPKGTNFDCVSWRELDVAVDQLNHRPRKCLGYRTPAEVLQNAFPGCV